MVKYSKKSSNRHSVQTQLLYDNAPSAKELCDIFDQRYHKNKKRITVHLIS